MSRKLILRTLNVDIPTVGTAQQITANQILTPFIRFIAAKGNTNGVFIGDENVSSSYKELNNTENTEYWASQKGDFTEGPWFDLRDWYADTDNAGNDVIVEYYEVQ